MALTNQQWAEFWALGDVNLDGKIDEKDLDLIQDNFNTFYPVCDINDNGVVDIDDYNIAYANFGRNIWDYFKVPFYERPEFTWVIIGGSIFVAGMLAAGYKIKKR